MHRAYDYDRRSTTYVREDRIERILNRVNNLRKVDIRALTEALREVHHRLGTNDSEMLDRVTRGYKSLMGYLDLVEKKIGEIKAGKEEALEEIVSGNFGDRYFEDIDDLPLDASRGRDFWPEYVAELAAGSDLVKMLVKETPKIDITDEVDLIHQSLLQLRYD